MSSYATLPADAQFVHVTNMGDDALDIRDCALTTFNVFTETTIGGGTIDLTGTIRAGAGMRIGSGNAPGVDRVIPDGTLPVPGALTILDQNFVPGAGTDVHAVLPFNVTSIVYLDGETVFGYAHVRKPEHDALYDEIYGAPAKSRVAAGDLAVMLDEARVAARPELPSEFALRQNYPNPFNPMTIIRFELPEPAAIRLAVFDLLGRRVSTVLEGPAEAGRHEVRFDAGGLPSGTYVYRLEAGDRIELQRHMVLVR